MTYALIAEPDRSRSSLLSGFVRDAGLEPVVVPDGQLALKELEARGRPSLLITELSMPKVDGFELLRNLAARKLSQPVPVVVVSAHLDLRSKAQQLKDELGITALLPRAVANTVLHQAIQDAAKGTLAAKAPAIPQAPLRRQATPMAPKVTISDPEGEAKRLARLFALDLVDELPPDEALQKLVRETASAFGVPVALVSLVLKDRQWFKAHVGLSGQLLKDRGTPRDWAFCHHVVDGNAPLIVPDATRHPYFADNPMVRQGAVVGYAGVPLKTSSGTVLGTLCVIDAKPLSLGRDQLETLVLFARRVAGEIELRAAARRKAELAERGKALTLLGAVLDVLDEGAMLLDPHGRILYANEALEALTGVPRAEMFGRTRDEFVARLAQQASDGTTLSFLLRVPKDGPYAAQEDIELVRPVRRVLRWKARPLDLESGGGQIGLYADVTAERELAARKG